MKTAKVWGQRLMCMLLAAAALTSFCAAAEAPDFPDISGHWAEETLRQAAADGLLSGFEDGTLRPDEPITQAQILTILTRLLGARPTAEPASLGLTGEEWYAQAALAAAATGLISDVSGITEPMTRQDAFVLLCRALGLTRSAPDRSVLEPYAEKDAPDEIVSLVALGLVEGYNGSLNLSGSISRAELVAVLYRALGETGAVRQDTELLENETLTDTLWFGAETESLQLSGVTAPEIVICSQSLRELRLEAAAEVERVVLTCGGSVSLYLSGGSRIGELQIAGDGCTLTLSGSTVEKLVIDGGDFRLNGWGGITETVLNTIHSQPPWNAGKLTDNRDFGIEGARVLTVSVPAELPVDTALEATATVSLPGSAAGKTARAQWYLGESLLAEEDVELESWQQTFTYEGGIPYSRDLPESAPVEFRLSYTGREVAQTVTGQSRPVKLENQDEAYFDALDRERVLELVDTGYEGDYTLAWAEANDYTDADKTLWVNAKGFASDTEYLIWVSLKYQRCNIFQGEQGAWELIRSGIVGTGATWSPTPEGVWKTTYKQEYGWTTATYTVKPVVRFKGGGYAFHSRLYYPNSSTLSDPSIGFPVSHGCIRMYDEDIQWIFDNIPENTTVVVF